jgi:predicted nucleotidyltransferase
MNETTVSFMSDDLYGCVVDFQRPVQALIPGAQGRILAVLAGTTAELNLRSIARVSGVSVAQASRVLPWLVELGVVERREVPPSALFTLVRENVASRLVLALADAHHVVLGELGQRAAAMSPSPVSLIVFGSFARGVADAASDLDLLVVRPAEVDDDDARWREGVDELLEGASRLSGNSVELVEVDEHDARVFLGRRKTLWRDIMRDGIVVHGLGFDELRARRSA